MRTIIRALQVFFSTIPYVLVAILGYLLVVTDVELNHTKARSAETAHLLVHVYSGAISQSLLDGVANKIITTDQQLQLQLILNDNLRDVDNIIKGK